jgi:IS4 transposase
MSTPSPDLALKTLFADIRRRLDQLPAESLARASGFLRRTPRKIPIPAFLAALIALGAETVLSLERIAKVIALAANVSYSKQALQQRLSSQIEGFLTGVATAWFQHTVAPAGQRGWLSPFPRVLLQDSTSEPVPERLAKAFPGSKSQRRKKGGNLKLQFVTDLVGACVLHWSLSGFTRNDQAAAADILRFARRGDLLLRDLGFFSLQVFRRLDQLGAFFLSRCQYGLNFYDPETGRKLALRQELKAHPRFDRLVLVGEEKVLLRLVAEPVSVAVANQRRRQARQNRDQRLNPSPERLFLLGWNIFLTNVPAEVWPPKALFWVYRLRWRIEIIFKAWKSHLRFIEFNRRNEPMARLSVLTKLLFCMMVVRFSDTLESLCGQQQHVSLLRVARVVGQCACLFAAAVLQITPAQWLAYQVREHIFYEQRTDRRNFYELIEFVDSGLGWRVCAGGIRVTVGVAEGGAGQSMATKWHSERVLLNI